MEQRRQIWSNLLHNVNNPGTTARQRKRQNLGDTEHIGNHERRMRGDGSVPAPRLTPGPPAPATLHDDAAGPPWETPKLPNVHSGHLFPTGLNNGDVTAAGLLGPAGRPGCFSHPSCEKHLRSFPELEMAVVGGAELMLRASPRVPPSSLR